MNSKVSFKTKPKAAAPLPYSAQSAPLPMFPRVVEEAPPPSDVTDEPEMVVEIEAPTPAATAIGTGPFEPETGEPEPGENAFDLAAALAAELGDEPLPFEQPEDASLTALDAAPAAAPSVAEPAPLIVPVVDGSQDARPLSRAIKRTEQLLAFVAVPRRPAKKL